MTIYERPTKSLVADWAKETLKPGQTFAKDDVIRWFTQHYPKIKSSTVNMHVEVMATNNNLRKHYPSIKPGSGHDLFYKLGRDEFRLWNQDTDPGPRYKSHLEEQGDAEENAKPQITNQQSNIDSLIKEFPRYLQIFEHNPPFKRYGQWEYHVETIELRRELGSAKAALYDDQFLAALYKTLQAWGIGIRASKLVSFETFVAALRAKSSEIIGLEDKAIDDPQMNVNEMGQQVWRLIDTLGIVDNNARIVAGSKALHHVLPELVVPMDRAYTQKFFCWQSPKFQYEQRSCFEQAFAAFAEIARKTKPSQYVGSGWHSSRTKVIDNALIGLLSDQKPDTPAIKGDKFIPPPKLTPIFQPSDVRPISLIDSIVRWCKSRLWR